MKTYVNIHSLDGDFGNYRTNLILNKETSKSLYCKSLLYGDTYRIEKGTGKVFCNGKQIASDCQYSLF